MDLRQQLKCRAMLAEEAMRYDDMMDAMSGIAMLDMELTAEERDLLSVAYKKVVISKRNVLKGLAYIEIELEDIGKEFQLKMTKEFRHKVEGELDKLCNNVVSIIDNHLLPYCSSVENKVFFYQMKGDYYRYLAEFKLGDAYSEVIDLSLEAYENACSIAEETLSPEHHIRLGLALSVSIFYYEMLDSPNRACEIAKQAMDDAIPNLAIDNEFYNKSAVTLQILGNNLVRWNLYSAMEFNAAAGRSTSGVTTPWYANNARAFAGRSSTSGLRCHFTVG